MHWNVLANEMQCQYKGNTYEKNEKFVENRVVYYCKLSADKFEVCSASSTFNS